MSNLIKLKQIAGGVDLQNSVNTNTQAISNLQTSVSNQIAALEASHFEGIKAEGQTDNDAIATAVGEAKPIDGDTCVIKEEISTGNYSYKAFVYDEGAWKAMDGNYNATNVYFSDDLLTTTAIGNITLNNGQATISAAGKNLAQVFETIFVAEDKDIKVTSPSVSMTYSEKYIEVGSSDSQSVTLTYADGEYEYGYTEETGSDGDKATVTVNDKTTGAEVTGYSLTYAGNAVTPDTEGGRVFTVNSGIQTTSTSKSANGIATYDAGYNPVSNLKNMYPSKAIKENTTGVSTGDKTLFKWYIPMYHGFKYSGATIASPASITAAEVKGLTAITGSTAYDKTKPTSETATGSWMQYFVAIPSSYSANKPSVIDSNNLPLTVNAASNVTLTFGTASVEYNVWYISLDAAYDTLSFTITW